MTDTQARHSTITRLATSFMLAAVVISVASLSYSAFSLVSAARPPDPEDIAADVLRRLNAQRAVLGAPALTINEDLVTLAQQRSDDMVAGDYFSHLPPSDRSTLGDLTVAHGLNLAYTPVENLARVPLTGLNDADSIARDVVNAWEDSPDPWYWASHPTQTLTGIGVAIDEEQVVITQLFWGAGFVPPDSTSMD